MQECAQLAGEHRGTEPPEVAAHDYGVGPAPKRHHPAAAGTVAVVLLLIDIDADLTASGTARA